MAPELRRRSHLGKCEAKRNNIRTSEAAASGPEHRPLPRPPRRFFEISYYCWLLRQSLSLSLCLALYQRYIRVISTLATSTCYFTATSCCCFCPSVFFFLLYFTFRGFLLLALLCYCYCTLTVLSLSLSLSVSLAHTLTHRLWFGVFGCVCVFGTQSDTPKKKKMRVSKHTHTSAAQSEVGFFLFFFFLLLHPLTAAAGHHPSSSSFATSQTGKHSGRAAGQMGNRPPPLLLLLHRQFRVRDVPPVRKDLTRPRPTRFFFSFSSSSACPFLTSSHFSPEHDEEKKKCRARTHTHSHTRTLFSTLFRRRGKIRLFRRGKSSFPGA